VLAATLSLSAAAALPAAAAASWALWDEPAPDERTRLSLPPGECERVLSMLAVVAERSSRVASRAAAAVHTVTDSHSHCGLGLTR